MSFVGAAEVGGENAEAIAIRCLNKGVFVGHRDHGWALRAGRVLSYCHAHDVVDVAPRFLLSPFLDAVLAIK